MRGTVSGKSTATIAVMVAVFTNILEATEIGKRRHLNAFLMALAASAVTHCLILSQSAGSAQVAGPPEAASLRSAPQVFSYITLPAVATDPVSPTMHAPEPPPVNSAVPHDQKPAAGTANLILIETPDERYLRAKTLDARPTPIGSLAFPPPKLGIAAKPVEVRLRIFINEYGAVDFVRVEGDSPGSEFVDPIIETLKKSRFSPGQVSGGNVKSQMVLGWKFETESNE